MGGRIGGCVGVAFMLPEVLKEEKGDEEVAVDGSGGCGWAGECLVGLRPEVGGAVCDGYCCAGGEEWAKVFRDGVTVGFVGVDIKEWEPWDEGLGIE